MAVKEVEERLCLIAVLTTSVQQSLLLLLDRSSLWLKSGFPTGCLLAREGAVPPWLGKV